MLLGWKLISMQLKVGHPNILYLVDVDRRIVVHRRLWDTQGPSLLPPETARQDRIRVDQLSRKDSLSPSPVVHAFLTSFARFFPEILERDQYRLFHGQKSVKHEQECKLKGKSISPSTSQSHHHLTIFALLRFNRSSHQGRTMLPKFSASAAYLHTINHSSQSGLQTLIEGKIKSQ